MTDKRAAADAPRFSDTLGWPRPQPGTPCAECGARLDGWPCIHHEDSCSYFQDGDLQSEQAVIESERADASERSPDLPRELEGRFRICDVQHAEGTQHWHVLRYGDEPSEPASGFGLTASEGTLREALEAIVEAWHRGATRKPIEQVQLLIPAIIQARAALRPRHSGQPPERCLIVEGGPTHHRHCTLEAFHEGPHQWGHSGQADE